MYGRHKGLPIAAAYPIMIPGLTAAVRRLVGLEHKRIVMLAREERRKPQLSRPEQAFIDELDAVGITTGDYNLPDWEESREGLGRLLDQLFRFSRPTALILLAQLFIAVGSHLADRGIVASTTFSSSSAIRIRASTGAIRLHTISAGILLSVNGSRAQLSIWRQDRTTNRCSVSREIHPAAQSIFCL